MTKMNKFMVVHNDPEVDCEIVQANWRKLAKVESATWIRTYINEQKGIRYCLWFAPDEQELKKVFDQISVSFESILPVEETVPDLWGEKWQEHLEKDAAADNLGD
jgi:Nickel responsive protein SCO4226-like